MQSHTIKQDAACVLSRGASQCVDQRGFAGAVAPQQRQGFTRSQCKTDLIQNDSFAITGCDLVQLHQISHACPLDRGRHHARAGLLQSAQVCRRLRQRR